MKHQHLVTGTLIFCVVAALTINQYRFSLSLAVGPGELGQAAERLEPAAASATFTTEEITSGLSLVPSFRGGEATGIKVFGIRPDSWHGRLGLENGDVVRSVNGIELTTPDRALGAYTQLRSARHFSIELERRGEPMTIEISVVKG